MLNPFFNYFNICTAVFLIFICQNTNAQDSSYNSYITTDNGLVNNEVTAIKQDKYGFLWFGTRGGLNKYDGYNLKLIRKASNYKNNFSSQAIEVLFEGKNNLWVGTKAGGLNKYDFLKDSISQYTFNSTEGINNILSLYEADNGNLFIGSSNGFYCLEQKTQKFKIINKTTKVYDIQPDGKGGLWLASNRGLLHYNSANKIIFQTSFGFKYITLTTIAIDKVKGIMYVGSWGKGMLSYNYKNGEIKRYINDPENNTSISSNNPFRLFIDKNSDLWIGTWGGGLNKFNTVKQTFSHYRLTSEDNFNYENKIVLSIEQDRSGIIWLGTEGGIYRVDCQKKKFYNITYQYNNPFSLKNTHITSVFIDSNNALWVGTKDGGLEYSKDRKSFKKVDLGKDVLRINCVFQNNEKLWVGTGNGLVIFDGLDPKANKNYYTQFSSPENLNGKKITTILKDQYGTIWVGTQETGLSKVIGYNNNGSPLFKQYPHSLDRGNLQSERVSCMLSDNKGRLWIGTYNGLHLYNREKDSFQNFKHQINSPRSISNSIILSIAQDCNGNIWIGTASGLNKVVEEKNKLSFQSFFANDNFPNDYVNAILPDSHSQIWLSTNKGITCFNTLNKKIRNFDIRDGLSSNTFSENASFLSKNGTMYFGGIKGITYFHPDSIKINHMPPPIYFTNLQINDVEVRVGQKVAGDIPLSQALFATKRITLNYKQAFITVSFAALDYHATDKNQYAYRLKGFQDKWVYSGRRRNATYTNLPSGNYTLEVIASNSDNIWNNKGAELQIKVLPPPWKTWWAISIYIVLFSFLLWLSRYIGLNRLILKNKLEIANLSLKREREIIDIKSKLFTNISHEFRTPLTLMIGPLNDLSMMENLNLGVKKTVVRLQDQTKRLLNLVNQLLDFQKAETNQLTLNVSRSNLVAFSKEIFQSFYNEAKRRKIKFEFSASSSQIIADFDEEKMTIILYNLLSNSLKFSESGGYVKLSLNIISHNFEPHCELIVSDTGKGIGEKELEKIFDRYYQVAKTDAGKFAGTGIGLAFTRDLVLLHNGTISVESELGKGSSFHILLPLHPDYKLGGNEPLSELLEPISEPDDDSMLSIDDDIISEKPIILIVEDNDEVNEYIVSVLKNTYKTLSAKNGKEGLLKAFDTVPDVIISDVMMPEIDGYELCKKLKTDQRTSHIPIILLTAQNDSSSQIKGITEGADIYLSKPFNPQVLTSHLKNLIKLRKKLKELFTKKISLEPKEIEITSFEEDFIKKIISKVEENLTNPEFQTDDLAFELNMSRSTFYRKLKALTDMSGSEFIKFIRLKRSAQLLASKELTINEVAYEVGFNDTKYFRKCFHKQFAMAPSEYQKKETAQSTDTSKNNMN
nr:hybrid sensor histidine kinase/response regulator transcription factor [uncultured Pedobacter sp.]